MKKYILIFLCLMMVSGSFAQIKDFKFKFYGQIRTDLYYNSRANEETVDGLFYMYPKDKVRDEDGNDLNGTPSSTQSQQGLFLPHITNWISTASVTITKTAFSHWTKSMY